MLQFSQLNVAKGENADTRFLLVSRKNFSSNFNGTRKNWEHRYLDGVTEKKMLTINKKLTDLTLINDKCK